MNELRHIVEYEDFSGKRFKYHEEWYIGDQIQHKIVYNKNTIIKEMWWSEGQLCHTVEYYAWNGTLKEEKWMLNGQLHRTDGQLASVTKTEHHRQDMNFGT